MRTLEDWKTWIRLAITEVAVEVCAKEFMDELAESRKAAIEEVLGIIEKEKDRGVHPRAENDFTHLSVDRLVGEIRSLLLPGQPAENETKGETK